MLCWRIKYDDNDDDDDDDNDVSANWCLPLRLGIYWNM